MARVDMELPATPDNFDEVAYLRGNPDVAEAVRAGAFASGRAHFDSFGMGEERRLRRLPAVIAAAKRAKHERIRRVLRGDMPFVEREDCFDFLTPELRARSGIAETAAVSRNDYNDRIVRLIESLPDGLLLDCGAGRRSVYFDNVVNLEVAAYDTTDVLGIGEELPFGDGVFDAVVSRAVLEHVRDPFRCADEIVRVLKPGGRLVCAVPFLAPYHGYPHHYYNMTHQGLANLFEGKLAIDGVEVLPRQLPIWALTWIVQSWAAGLSGWAREEFLNLGIRDLLNSASTFLDRGFVRGLTEDKNLELASATVLFARKPPVGGAPDAGAQEGGDTVRIDIGCGARRKAGYTGIDKTAAPGVDLVVDFETQPLPIADDSVEAIHSSHCLEHLADPHRLLSELLRVGRDGASFELWLPYLKSNDAFVFGHRMFYNELIMARISATGTEFWFPRTEGVMRLDRVIYVLCAGIADELARMSIPLHFAIKHLFNIVVEWGLFFTLQKGPEYRDRSTFRASVQPPQLFVAGSREDAPVPLEAPLGYWELR